MITILVHSSMEGKQLNQMNWQKSTPITPEVGENVGSYQRERGMDGKNGQRGLLLMGGYLDVGTGSGEIYTHREVLTCRESNNKLLKQVAMLTSRRLKTSQPLSSRDPTSAWLIYICLFLCDHIKTNTTMVQMQLHAKYSPFNFPVLL